VVGGRCFELQDFVERTSLPLYTITMAKGPYPMSIHYAWLCRSGAE